MLFGVCGPSQARTHYVLLNWPPVWEGPETDLVPRLPSLATGAARLDSSEGSQGWLEGHRDRLREPAK